MKELLGRICSIEEMIEENYLKIFDAEVKQDLSSYDYYFQNLQNLLVMEENLICSISSYGYIPILKELIKEVKSVEANYFALGHLTNSYFLRLIDITDRYEQDYGLEYIYCLKYDMNKIILCILNGLIDHPYFEDIREDLILYKYNLIFLNRDSEADFIYGQEDKSVELKSKEYRSIDFPSSTYLDLGFLVFFSEQNINRIYGSSIENSWDKMKIVSYVLDILARLTLCSIDNLELIYGEVDALMHSEVINEEVKELFLNLLRIYESVKDNLVWHK